MTDSVKLKNVIRRPAIPPVVIDRVKVVRVGILSRPNMAKVICNADYCLDAGGSEAEMPNRGRGRVAFPLTVGYTHGVNLQALTTDQRQSLLVELAHSLVAEKIDK